MTTCSMKKNWKRKENKIKKKKKRGIKYMFWGKKNWNNNKEKEKKWKNEKKLKEARGKKLKQEWGIFWRLCYEMPNFYNFIFLKICRYKII
jgi:hypothetical protein